MTLRHWLEGNHWWFQNPDPDGPNIGPYDTKREMLEDKAGVERTASTKTWQSITETKHEVPRHDESCRQQTFGWR
jgi:hypothetical protein